jgi:hypothetical protein
MSVIPLTGQTYRHVKNGHLYRVLFADARIEATNTEAVVYRRADMDVGGVVWVRPYTEFCDGRFVHVSATERLNAIGHD